MVIGYNLLHLAPGSVLIFNTNIIPLSVKILVADGAPKKNHIYGASILGGSATVQLWKK